MIVREIRTRNCTAPEPLSAPEAVYRHVWPTLRGEKREHLVAIYLDSRNVPIARETISIGTLNASLVHAREVYRPAIGYAAASVIVAHNHPSGDPSPSEEDRAVTRRLKEVGELVGIQLLDHVIVAASGYYSIMAGGR